MNSKSTNPLPVVIRSMFVDIFLEDRIIVILTLPPRNCAWIRRCFHRRRNRRPPHSNRRIQRTYDSARSCNVPPNGVGIPSSPKAARDMCANAHGRMPTGPIRATGTIARAPDGTVRNRYDEIEQPPCRCRRNILVNSPSSCVTTMMDTTFIRNMDVPYTRIIHYY